MTTSVTEPATNDDNDVFTTFDPEDPNYKDPDLLVKIQKIYQELPEGWSKGTGEPGSPPFVHVSGKISWKHPGRDKVMELVAAAQAEEANKPKKQRWERGYNPQKAMIKRLRMMIKSGVPVAAVEQRAKLEGISLDVLLDENDEMNVSVAATQQQPRRSLGCNASSPNKQQLPKNKDPFKKYRLMLKNGIPMQAVQQTAVRDGVDPAEALLACGIESGQATTKKQTPGNSTSSLKHPQDPLKKYRTMLKNGVPLVAVQRHMTIDGLDPAELDRPEGDDIVAVEKKKKPTDKDCAKYRAMLQRGVPLVAVHNQMKMDGLDPTEVNLNETATASAPPIPETSNLDPARKAEETANAVDPTALFWPKGKNQLEFKTFPDGTSEALLSKMVRRMVQTVSKRASFKTGDNLSVDTLTLYNALGAFVGVQTQLEEYNQTFDDDDQKNDEGSSTAGGHDVRPMRKPFLELARNLGMTPDGPTSIPGLDELVDYLKGAFKQELGTIQANLDAGMYDFDSLAQIYRPGTKVVAKNVVAGGIDMICRVEWNRYEQGRTLFGVSKYFKVCLVFCVAVGEHFTLAEVVQGMESFDGLRRLKDLPFVPLTAYSDGEIKTMMSNFQKRGEIYTKVATGANYLSYTKGSFFAKSTSKNSAAALATHGRVMIDTQGAYDFGHTLGVGYDPMIMATKYKYKEYMLHMRSVKNNQNPESSGSTGDDGMMLFETVPKEYLEMTWPAVIGFSLTSKAWGDVLVDGLGEIGFQEKVFDNLVLPAARKRMVKALVRHSSDSFNDVISGKGEGSVFLLYGPPGVGKTLTAEAISEMLHRPLYSVSLGQLGTTPADLESKLGEILELCSKWDALILLDEADIFLEKRSSTGSLERNAMVSVMLRLVEYFKGVLFLTSNRVDSLDPAFKTRITLALRYDQLDPAARQQVWKNLLLASGHDLDAFDTGALAKHVLNGREIKNAIRLAMALAADEETDLSQNLILETVDILNDFNEKMNSADAY